MSLIQDISLNISNKLGDRLNKTDEEKAVLNYGLFMILHTSLAIILTFIIGIITNTLVEIMIISLSSSMLKRYSGGVHSSTPNRCIITGIIFTLFLANICRYLNTYIDGYLLLVTIVISLLYIYYVIYRKCPVASKNKPFKKESTRKMIRKKAFSLLNIYTISIIILYFLYLTYKLTKLKIILISLILGIILQVFAITNIGAKLIYILEYIYDMFNIK